MRCVHCGSDKDAGAFTGAQKNEAVGKPCTGASLAPQQQPLAMTSMAAAALPQVLQRRQVPAPHSARSARAQTARSAPRPAPAHPSHRNDCERSCVPKRE